MQGKLALRGLPEWSRFHKHWEYFCETLPQHSFQILNQREGLNSSLSSDRKELPLSFEARKLVVIKQFLQQMKMFLVESV